MTEAQGRFAAGDRVRVRRGYPPTHFRTPLYAQGKTGVVEHLYGAYRNPEGLAYGRDGLPKAPLYRVRFAQRHLWPEYAGAAHDTLCIDLYDHWLEPDEGAL